MPKVYIKPTTAPLRPAAEEPASVNRRIDASHEVGTSDGSVPGIVAHHGMSNAEIDASAAAIAQMSEVAIANPQVLLAAAGATAAANIEQAQRQAAQLAEFLRNKQQELDERESRLNARDSELEQKSRVAKLWYQEQTRYFQQRDAELDQRLSEVEQRATEISLQSLTETRQETAAQQATNKVTADLVVKLRTADEKIRSLESEYQTLQQSYQQLSNEKRLADETLLAERKMFAKEKDVAAKLASNKISTDLSAQLREAETRIQLLESECKTLQQSQQLLKNEKRLAEDTLLTERKILAKEKEAAEYTVQQLMLNLERERESLHKSERQLIDRLRQAETPKPVNTDNSPQPAHIQAREQQLEQLEILCREQWDACENDRRQLEAAQRQLLEEMRVAKLEAQRARQAMERELEEKRNNIARREEEVERHQAAVEQLHAVVSKQHHESLEMRLVTEQLWSQMAGRQNATELTRSIAALRDKLADEHRLESQAVAEQQQEIRQLTERLDEQQSLLRKQRLELQAWVRHRHEEIEEQAARLIAREQELDRQKRQMEEQKSQRDEEHRALQRQIRELASQLRTNRPAKAA